MHLKNVLRQCIAFVEWLWAFITNVRSNIEMMLQMDWHGILDFTLVETMITKHPKSLIVLSHMHLVEFLLEESLPAVCLKMLNLFQNLTKKAKNSRIKSQVVQNAASHEVRKLLASLIVIECNAGNPLKYNRDGPFARAPASWHPA